MIDHRGQPAGKCVRWPVRPDTRQPVWNVARGLGLPPLSYRRLRRATLHAQVWHADPLLSDTLMGALALPLRPPLTLSLCPSLSLSLGLGLSLSLSLSLRLKPKPKPEPEPDPEPDPTPYP